MIYQKNAWCGVETSLKFWGWERFTSSRVLICKHIHTYSQRPVQVTRLCGFFPLMQSVYSSIHRQHINVYSYSRPWVCRDATPYPCCPTASKTNRQHAHDAWLYERERGKGKRKRKSEQDEVGAKTTELQFAWKLFVSERSTSSEQLLKDNGTRNDPSVFLKLVCTPKCMRGVSLHLLFIFPPWMLLIDPSDGRWLCQGGSRVTSSCLAWI